MNKPSFQIIVDAQGLKLSRELMHYCLNLASALLGSELTHPHYWVTSSLIFHEYMAHAIPVQVIVHDRRDIIDDVYHGNTCDLHLNQLQKPYERIPIAKIVNLQVPVRDEDYV